jgi:hypothetical protein
LLRSAGVRRVSCLFLLAFLGLRCGDAGQRRRHIDLRECDLHRQQGPASKPARRVRALTARER